MNHATELIQEFAKGFIAGRKSTSQLLYAAIIISMIVGYSIGFMVGTW